MSIIVRSLINEAQTLDSVVLSPFATQVRAGRTAALTTAETARQIQIDTYDEGNAVAAVDEPLFVGTVSTADGVSCTVRKTGPVVELVFTLDAVELTVTDAAASGSSASLKLFDFVEGVVVPLGCRQDYTAFAEGAALTGAAGDAAFVMGLGSAAADAGDGALSGTEVNFGAATSTITLSGGTGTGTQVTGASATALNGTATAVDLYLNWSGSAATIDATSTISVTGTVTVACLFLGDD